MFDEGDKVTYVSMPPDGDKGDIDVNNEDVFPDKVIEKRDNAPLTWPRHPMP